MIGYRKDTGALGPVGVDREAAQVLSPSDTKNYINTKH